jgi:hypothetical protein
MRFTLFAPFTLEILGIWMDHIFWNEIFVRYDMLTYAEPSATSLVSIQVIREKRKWSLKNHVKDQAHITRGSHETKRRGIRV